MHPRRCKVAKLLGQPAGRWRRATGVEGTLARSCYLGRLVCRSAQAKTPANPTKMARTAIVISNASVGIMPLPLKFQALFFDARAPVLDSDQIAKRIGERLGSGGRQRFCPRRIQQADTAMDDRDDAIALQLGEGSAYCLNGQAEVVRNILAAHRQ